MAKIFLSHSTKDKPFVKKLAQSLWNLGHTVGLDIWDILVGDKIVSKIEADIESADFVAVVLSKNGLESGWVETEWQAKYWDEIQRREILVLPIRLDDCEIPFLLRGRKYADFRVRYEVGLVALAISLQHRSNTSGIAHYYADFVTIPDGDWIELFKHSTTLDSLMMYSATWRNTYFKNIKSMLARPGGRLRIVLPDFINDSALAKVNANRMQMKSRELKNRIIEAIRVYNEFAQFGTVEIFTTSHYLTHALYLFDTGGIVALYSFQADRVPTPAFGATDGELLQFARTDFEWLVSERNPTLKRIRPDEHR